MCSRSRMNIGIGSKIVIAVAQPCLNVFHAIIQIKHNCSTAMSQIVIPNFAKAIFLQYLLKFLRYKIRLKKFTHTIYTNKIKIPCIVASATQMPLCSLLLLQIPEVLIGLLTEGQTSFAGSCLGDIFTNHCTNKISFFFI